MPQDNEGYRTNYSAFGGHPIDTLTDERVGKTLEQFAITDAEQLIAAAAVPNIRGHLEEALAGSGTELGDLVEKMQTQLGAQLTATYEAPTNGHHALGAMEPTAEIEAEIASIALVMPFGFDAVSLPASVNHALNMSPVRQQGSRGTCVAHALTAVHEHHRRMSGSPQDFSEQFLYHRIKQVDGAPATCGTWQVKSVPVFTNVGQCRENVWAYNPQPPCNNNGVEPANAAADAAQFKVQPIVLGAKDVPAIKSALAGGSCVGFSIAVYNSWYQSAYTTQTGRISMRLGTEPSVGGHAMCFIGYHDDASAPGGGFFILRNSWGAGWGSQCPYGAGNGTIPYAYIANEGWEAVTMPPPRRRLNPRDLLDWRRRWPFFTGEEGGDGDGQNGEGRTTIVIESDGTFDIVIK